MYLFAGVVQWLVHGLAKAGMPVRFWSLAPCMYLAKCNKLSFFILFFRTGII